MFVEMSKDREKKGILQNEFQFNGVVFFPTWLMTFRSIFINEMHLMQKVVQPPKRTIE